MTTPKPAPVRQARWALSFADLEADLLAQMLKRLYQCEQAEEECAAAEQAVRRQVEAYFADRKVVNGSKVEDYLPAAIANDMDVKNLVAKQQWLDKRATMYATALIAVQNYQARHPMRKLPEITL